jgi:hypothetical protein
MQGGRMPQGKFRPEIFLRLGPCAERGPFD